MKTILRTFLINFAALWLTSQIIPALAITGGARGMIIGTLAFMLTNIILVPLLKILLLPLNLLTLGLFAWLSNIIALYLLATNVSSFKITAYSFSGLDLGFVVFPPLDLTTFQVAIVASFIIGLIIHFAHWLTK